MAQPTGKSAVNRVVRTPIFRKRIERDRTKFYRKDKHKAQGF